MPGEFTNADEMRVYQLGNQLGSQDMPTYDPKLVVEQIKERKRYDRMRLRETALHFAVEIMQGPQVTTPETSLLDFKVFYNTAMRALKTGRL